MRKNSIAVLVVFAQEGIIDNYVVFLVEQVKAIVKTVAVTINGNPSNEFLEKLSQCSDYIFVRENEGFDCGAYKDTLEKYLGWDQVREYDELILLNDSCYGPIYPLEPIFEQMDKRGLDFWGMTEQTPIKAGNFCNALLPYHIQTYFVVISRRMLMSRDFSDFWDSVKLSNGYDDTVANFELKFTAFFNKLGYTSGAYVDCKAFCKSVNETQAYVFMDSFRLISEHGCPFLKKKVFLYPHNLVLSSNMGETAYKTLEYVTENTDYDEDLIWQHLIRTCEPKELYLSLHSNYCLSTDDSDIELDLSEKILVIASLTSNEMLDKCRTYLDLLPSSIDVICIEQNTGYKDIDIEAYKYICYLNNDELENSLLSIFWENMISTSFYVDNIIDLFHKHPRLGLLSPPKPYHAQYFADMQSEICLFPYGNMFWCKREALQPLLGRIWEEDDFDKIDKKEIFSSLPYIVKSQGYACGIVMSEEYASLYASNYHYMLSGLASNVLLDIGVQEFKNIKRVNSHLIDFCNRHSYCYIYGAGECGRACNVYLQSRGIKVDGYVVSDGKKSTHSDTDIRILELSEIDKDERTGVIIAMGPFSTSVVIKMLKERGFYEYIQYEE